MKREIAQKVAALVDLPVDQVEGLIEVPKNSEHGELAFPCFILAKSLKKSPLQIAGDLAAQIADDNFTTLAVGPYLNFKANRENLVRGVVESFMADQQAFGRSDVGCGKQVVVDFSSPNIAKPLAFHHIRSTMIGNSLVKMHRNAGYTVTGINHLGDWGTQFGYIIAAFKDRDEAAIEALELPEVIDAYVSMNRRAKEESTVEDMARSCFLDLENGEITARRIWQKCRDLSLAEFDRVYKRLGVSFDSNIGEAFFEDKLDALVERVEATGITSLSEGALIVDLEDKGINTPCLLRKSDGATLYATRDLAAACYRHETYNFDKAFYVTDSGQSLHFRQFFAVLEKMGVSFAADMHHAPFGVLLVWDESSEEWTKGRTRSGQVILLEDILNEATKRAAAIIDEKRPDLPNRELVAEQVGIGAVVFNDLKHRRIKDVKFSFEDAINFEGETGPYLQYSAARAASVVRKYAKEVALPTNYAVLADGDGFEIIKKVATLPEVSLRACAEGEPYIIANFCLELAAQFNSFYAKVRILDSPDVESLIIIPTMVAQTLTKGLDMLGIAVPDQM